MIPRVLLVEDDPHILRSNEKHLLKMTAEQKATSGIEGFIIDKAMSRDEAFELLKKAKRKSLPYDLVLLDLRLPISKENPKESNEHGVEVLKFAYEIGAARGVMIVSVFSMYDWVVRCFREGAVDFIGKPFLRETLQTQVIKYFEKEGARILNQRVEMLAPYSEKGLAYRLGVCFSRFVQSVVNETEGLQEGFKERWELDISRDSSDYQVRHLILIEEAVNKAKREWSDVLSETVSEISGEAGAPHTCILEEVLKRLKDYVTPSLALKRVKMPDDLEGETAVRAFRGDVTAVLQEIILGALTQRSDHDAPEKSLTVSLAINNNRAEVCVEDDFGLIPAETVQSVNNGAPVSSEPSFDRAWGLSVAQNIAQRAGGRLKVESNNEGNRITYSIPLGNHA